jgi:hypothetical protein
MSPLPDIGKGLFCGHINHVSFAQAFPMKSGIISANGRKTAGSDSRRPIIQQIKMLCK